ncbi:MAG: UDP-N-acetylglucosamine 2-epimerase (non-hydrolyzing) [Fibrobacter sp.]|nr:UDP-N-acetylglucosamine 2-epimerase (non-hydrolyzing) [Fibrobacter sp.]
MAKKVFLVAGARPNFMKIAPIIRAMKKHPGLTPVLIHTGQHYDKNMSGTFFESLGIPDPDYNLQVGSASHAVQTAEIMVRFEEICIKEKPDVVLVVGDVNSTIAAGLAAKKLNITLAHVEAGLRSGDRTMPEEINRLATDAITDLFFTTEKEATSNLLKEGHASENVHFVGHVMIDNLFYQLKTLDEMKVLGEVVAIKKQLPQKYICMTMHRPSNVDNKENLEKILTAINVVSKTAPVVFPIHPRTKKNIEQFNLGHLLDTERIITTQPLDYNDFLYLWKDVALMVTDSGGLQEETTALKIPCITIRENTERPITVEVGSNVVVGTDSQKIIDNAMNALQGKWKCCAIPELWDGLASERIADLIGDKKMIGSNDITKLYAHC